MSRGLLIGSAVIAGGGLAWLLLRERKTLAESVELQVAIAKSQAVAALKAGKKVGRKVAQMLTGITQPKLDNINKYNIAALANHYGPDIPFGLKMAMIEHESADTFDPLIYNYYVKDYSKNPDGEPVVNEKGKKILRSTRATPGAAPVVRWLAANRAEPMKNGGFAYDPHAVGLLQILDNIRINPPKGQPFNYGGVPLPYLNDLIDPEKNIKAALAGAQANAKTIKGRGVTDEDLLGRLIYFAHAEGIYRLAKEGGKYPSAFAKLEALGKAIIWDNIKALPWGTVGWWALGNPGAFVGVPRVSDRAPTWEVAKANLLAQAQPLTVAAGQEIGSPEEVTEGWTEADQLLLDLESAERLGDFDTALEIKEQLRATFPDMWPEEVGGTGEDDA